MLKGAAGKLKSLSMMGASGDTVFMGRNVTRSRCGKRKPAFCFWQLLTYHNSQPISARLESMAIAISSIGQVAISAYQIKKITSILIALDSIAGYRGSANHPHCQTDH